MLFNKGNGGGGISYTLFKKEVTGVPNINPRYVWDAIIGQDEVVDFKPKKRSDNDEEEL